MHLSSFWYLEIPVESERVDILDMVNEGKYIRLYQLIYLHILNFMGQDFPVAR